MKMLLVMAAATLLTTALGHATARQVGQSRPVARRSDGLGPDVVRGAVRVACPTGDGATGTHYPC